MLRVCVLGERVCERERERERCTYATISELRFSCDTSSFSFSSEKENSRYLFDNSISYENQADVSTSLSCTEAPSPCTHLSFLGQAAIAIEI